MDTADPGCRTGAGIGAAVGAMGTGRASVHLNQRRSARSNQVSTVSAWLSEAGDRDTEPASWMPCATPARNGSPVFGE
jgi:hypothetical protein